MALYKTDAIFLRVQPFAEADRLATLLTPDRGKVRAIAKGAQKGRGALTAAVQPFVRARLVLWQGRQIDGISQAEVVAAHRGLSADLARMAAASYCCDLVDAFTAERQETEGVFALLAQALAWCDAAPAEAHTPVLLRWFELGLLRLAGFLPELITCTACARPLGEPQGRTRFSATGGGLLCGDCSGNDPTGVWLSRNAVRALRHISASDAAGLGVVRVGPLTMGEMDTALARHIGGIVQRPLVSRAVLDTLS